jgi:DNA polymerase-3 subunit delta
MYFDDFLTKLKKGEPANFVLLFGDSESVISEGASLLKEKFKQAKPEGIVQTFDGLEHEMLDIISAAQSSGLFSTSQLLIFKNAQKDSCLGGRSEGAQKLLQSYFENPNMDSYMVFLAPGMKKTVGAVKAAERLGWAVQCGDMPEWKLLAWIKQQAQNKGLTISEESAQWLVQKVGNDIAYLQRALEQLADYIYPAKAIQTEHVKELAVPGVESEIFPFLDAVALRQTDKALQLMVSLQDGVDTGTTMMLYGRMRELLLVAVGKASGLGQAQAAEALGLHPFRAKNLWEQAGHYTVDELKQAMKDLIHIQAGVVTGRLTKTVPTVLLEWWVLKWGKNKMAVGAKR